MPTQSGGKWRRQNGKLVQVSEPAKEQRFGAHAVHPSEVSTRESKSEAPAAAPSEAVSAAKTKAPVKGNDDASATT